MYSITTLSKLTGVNAATIRSWERRYEIVKPLREANGRRTYTDNDIRRLNLIAALVQSGHPIGRIAKLDPEALEKLSARSEAATSASQSGLVDRIMSAAVSYDINEFRLLVGTALINLPPAEAIESVIVPVLQRVGEGWADGKIDVGLEHSLSAIIKQLLLSSINTMRWSASGPKMAFATLSGELHEIGSLMACYLAATRGRDCHYYGPNMPSDDLVSSMSVMGIEILVLSAVHSAEGVDPCAELFEIARRAPDDIEIWLGCSEQSPLLQGPLPERVTTFTSFTPFMNRIA